MNREAIYAALFARVRNAAAFNTTSRRLRHWTDVSAAEQPALFMVEGDEDGESRRGAPTKWTMPVELYLYCQAPDDIISPSEILNPLVDAVLGAALTPQIGMEQAQNVVTLGGLVSEVTMNGKITRDQGALGGQAVAIIPLRIIAAG